MREILIVPDVHGRTFWEPVLDYKGEIIFLGDYVDPYPSEGITQANACYALSEIVKFKQQNPDRVTLLIGNHELHYYNRDFEASRFSEEYYEEYHAILTGKTTAGLFQVCRQIDNYLFIHAGITKGWYDWHDDELQALGDNLETQLNRLFLQNQGAFFEVSGERGGWDRYGSPLSQFVRTVNKDFFDELKDAETLKNLGISSWSLGDKGIWNDKFTLQYDAKAGDDIACAGNLYELEFWGKYDTEYKIIEVGDNYVKVEQVRK
jgi:hypothetical protein